SSDVCSSDLPEILNIHQRPLLARIGACSGRGMANLTGRREIRTGAAVSYRARAVARPPVSASRPGGHQRKQLTLRAAATQVVGRALELHVFRGLQSEHGRVAAYATHDLSLEKPVHIACSALPHLTVHGDISLAQAIVQFLA